jgi:hypothetical protein
MSEIVVVLTEKSSINGLFDPINSVINVTKEKLREFESLMGSYAG